MILYTNVCSCYIFEHDQIVNVTSFNFFLCAKTFFVLFVSRPRWSSVTGGCGPSVIY
jgi:hypothetical protein